MQLDRHFRTGAYQGTDCSASPRHKKSPTTPYQPHSAARHASTVHYDRLGQVVNAASAVSSWLWLYRNTLGLGLTGSCSTLFVSVLCLLRSTFTGLVRLGVRNLRPVVPMAQPLRVWPITIRYSAVPWTPSHDIQLPPPLSLLALCLVPRPFGSALLCFACSNALALN